MRRVVRSALSPEKLILTDSREVQVRRRGIGGEWGKLGEGNVPEVGGDEVEDGYEG